jgi:ribosome assembly protein YihI (activator of Der GTPase)
MREARRRCGRYEGDEEGREEKKKKKKQDLRFSQRWLSISLACGI